MAEGDVGAAFAAPGRPTRWQVAVHEAAHAVFARHQAVVVKLVTVEGIVAVENGGRYEEGTSLGSCRLGGWAGLDTVGRCVLSLVGTAAARRAGWSERLLPYEEFVRDAEGRHPESDEAKVLRELRGLALEHPKALYGSAREGARAFVEGHWPEIMALAERFMWVVSLNEEGIELVFDPGWFEFREMLDGMALKDDLAPWVKAAMEAAETEDPGELAIGPDGGLVPEG